MLAEVYSQGNDLFPEREIWNYADFYKAVTKEGKTDNRSQRLEWVFEDDFLG